MPDIIPPSQPTSNTYIPTLDGGRPTLDSAFNDWNTAEPYLGPTNEEYAKSIATGPSITDLINDVNNMQAQNEALLAKYGEDRMSTLSTNIFDGDKAFQKAQQDFSKQSLQAGNKPVVVGTEAEFNRYAGSENFQTFGYDQRQGEEQEFKYGRAMDWGDTMGKALAGGAHLAADTFVEGWKGWGRMTEALFTWDSSKLYGSPEERYEMAKHQEEVMNKYAIYDDDTSKDTIWNRQFFGNMLQQSGFAVGAGLQFATEEFLTGGLSTFFKGAMAGALVGRLGKTLAETRQLAGLAEKSTLIGRTAERARALFRPKVVSTASDLKNTARKAMDVITGQEKVVNGLANGLKKLVPGYGSVDELVKLHKAGAGFAQLAFTGVGGIKRGLSEFNMARSESIYEAAGVYKDLTDKLTNEFVQKNGREPSADELERIRQSSEDASHDNFWTNMGVLSVMNRIQFDNMFKGFKKTRSLLGEGVASLKDEAVSVTAKNLAGKSETRAFAKGLLGGVSAVGEVAKVFGKKEAAWMATKSIGKGLMKFEGSEGMQELIQTAAQVGYEQYYEDLYHGKKGYGSKMDAVLSNMQNPFTDTEGMKTFLMGALTGRLIAPMSSGITGITTKITDRNKIKEQAAASKSLTESKIADFKEKNEGKAPEGKDLENIKAEVARAVPEYQTQKQKVQEAIQLFNKLADDPTWLAKEAIANIKVNNLAAANMEEAAANHDKYVFNNSRDSALAKTIAAAIKLDMYDSLRDVIKEHGVNMTDEEFKQAFGIEATKDNRKNVDSLTKNVVANIEDYYETYKNLIDKYQDVIIPELYKNNDPKVFANVNRQKAVLNGVIEMIATNSFKAKQVMKRANELQGEISSNENIGASSLEILTKLGNDQALNDHIQNLKKEIAAYEAAETKTPEQKDLYLSNKEELKLATDWLESRDELINEAIVDRSYTAFAGLINLFNKKAKNTAKVSKMDIEDAFLKFTDYIKLNRDHGEYVDAMNLLADPKNMKLVAQAEFSATLAFQMKMIQEQLAELYAGTGVDEEDVYKHTYEKQDDGTYTVFDHTGAVVATNIATEEEAKKMAEEKTAEQTAERKRLEEEEARKKAEEEGKTTPKIKLQDLKNDDDITINGRKAKVVIINKDIDGSINNIDIKYESESTLSYTTAEEIESLKDNIRVGKDGVFTSTKTGQPVTIDEIAAEVVNRPELDTILERIKNAENDNELSDALNHKNEVFGDLVPTPEEEKIIKDAYIDRKKVLDLIAKNKGNLKVVAKDDPTFVKAYNDVLLKIEEVVSKPNVTVKEVKETFRLLDGPLNMLSKADRQAFQAEQVVKMNAIVEIVKNNQAANDVTAIKDSITKMLSTDALPLTGTIDTVFNELNLTLSPEVKDEVIAHFEQEYLKAIDRKIAKLMSQVNTGVDNPVLKELDEVKEAFRKNLEKTLEELKAKSIEIKDKQKKVGTYLVQENKSFSTSTHRGISKGLVDRDSSEVQAMVIEEFMTSGLISPEEYRKGYPATRKGASILINRAVGRIYTMQINSAISEFHRSGSTTLLYESLLDYLKEVDVADTPESTMRQQIQAIIDHVKDPSNKKENDQELLDVINSVFGSSIPLVENITSEEYKLFDEFRKNITTIFRENNMLEMFKYADRQQKQIIDSGEVKANKIFPDDLLAFLDKTLDKKADVKKFRQDFIKTFEEILKSTDPDATNDLILTLTSTHMRKGMTNIQLVQSLMAYGLQTYNLAKTDEADVEPLTDVEMIQVLDNPTRSLSKTQIGQVETFAKTEQLDKHKKKLYAAVGYKTEPVSYTADLLEDKIVNTPFNSLRPKSSKDKRSMDALLGGLRATDGGTRTTMKNALQFIINSNHATPTEKVLAAKLMDVVADDEFIIIDNTIPAAGVYSVDTNTVGINLAAASYSVVDGQVVPSVPLETVILHELIHAVTESKLSDQTSEYYKGIKALFDVVKNQPGASTFYAFQEDLSEDDQLSEFVTEAFTNPAFQYMLAKTPYKNTNTSVWDKLLQFISDLFKTIGIDITNTALSEVLSLTDGIMNKQTITVDEELPSEAMLEKIKNAKTKEDLVEIKQQLETDKSKFTTDAYNALAASINRKMNSINAIQLKEVLKSYTSIKVDGVTYYYKVENNKINIVKRGNYRLNNVSNPKVVEKIVNQLLSKQKITELMSETQLEEIRSIAGNPDAMGSYASGMMPDSGETILEQRYPNIARNGATIRLNFGDLATYRKFKLDFRRYRKGKVTLDDLKTMYGSTAVRDFAEIYNRLGGKTARKKEFSAIDALIRKGYIKLEGASGSIEDLEDDGITYDELMDFYSDVIDGVDLNLNEYQALANDINKTLSTFLGMPVSTELQRKLEGDIFNGEQPDVTDEEENDEEEDTTTPAPNFTISSDLTTATYVQDPNSIDITKMEEGQTYITAVEKNGLRSKGNDGFLKTNPDGTSDYIENASFAAHYFKVRNIINKLALLSPDKLAKWHVTLDMDAEGLHWDGSAETTDWSKRGVIGYISDENGNPIVFDKEGNAIGRADRNDPASSRFNTGENQIVYFSTATATSDKRSLALFEQSSLEKLFKAREAVMAGRPQIGKVEKISKGQMVLKGLVKPNTKNQKNTARDKEFRDLLDQDHVSLQLIGKYLNVVIEDNDGGTNASVLFTPSTSAVKVTTPEGEFSLFDHLIELMKVYHKLKAEGYPRIGDIEAELTKFAWNMWYTGTEASLQIHKSFNNFTLRSTDPKTKLRNERMLSIFDNVNGEMVINQENYKKIKSHINNTKVNVYKGWLEGSVQFKFPYITTDENGKKMINFEDKDYKEFLVKDVGLITYINDIPTKANIKRYNSTVHFSEPTDLEIKKSPVVIDEKQMVNDENAMNNAVDNAVKDATPPAGKKIVSIKGKRFAPKIDKPYEKICK